MDSYTLFLAGAFALSIVVDLATWVRSRSLAVSLNAILFAVVGIVTLFNARTGGGEILFGCISLVISASWVFYGFLRYKRGSPRKINSPRSPRIVKGKAR